MESPANDKAGQRTGGDKDALSVLRHDINNQLSNIFLAMEQLRYELPDASADCIFYLDSIAMSAEKISALIKESGRSENPEA
jgi:hypothetical protein